jgi:hypothetical protein
VVSVLSIVVDLQQEKNKNLVSMSKKTTKKSNLLFLQLGQVTLEKSEEGRLDFVVRVHHRLIGCLGVFLHFSYRQNYYDSSM